MERPGRIAIWTPGSSKPLPADPRKTYFVGGYMSSTAEQLLNAVLALPEDERVELVEALLAALQPHDRPPFDESWREVIRRRSAELRSGQVMPVPWEDVKRQARERVGG